MLFSWPKVSLVILVIAGITISVAGMGVAEEPYLPPKAAQYRGIEITRIDCAGLMDPYADIHKLFEKATGIKIRYLLFPQHTLHDKLLMDLAAGTTEYDVIGFDNMWTEEIRPFVEPLNKYFNDPRLADPDFDIDDFVPATLMDYRHPHTKKGEPYGIASLATTVTPAYNKKIFEDAGVPVSAIDNWDALYEAAKKITRDIDGDGKIDVWGIPVAGHLHSPLPIWAYSFYGAWGGELFDTDYHPLWNSPTGWLATEFFVKVVQDTAPPASINWGLGEVGTAFKQGLGAVMINWNAGWPELNDPTKSQVAGQVGFAIPPKGPVRRRARQGSWGISLSKTSTKKEAAFVYMQWVTSKEMQIPLVKAGFMGAPMRLSAFRDPELLKLQPYFKVLEETYAKHCGHLPYIPEWWEIATLVAEYLHRAWLGELTAREAMEQSAAATEEILREAGYY